MPKLRIYDYGHRWSTSRQIGKELGYDYIFGYRTGDLVMYANPDFDITKQVIELLNNEYAADTNGRTRC